MARILIIDDEEPIRFSLQGILEDEGYEVLEAATAEEGLEVADAERPDLVFLDIWLPGMDGLTRAGAPQGEPSRSARRDDLGARNHRDRRKRHPARGLRFHRKAPFAGKGRHRRGPRP